MILPKFSKKCMKLRKILTVGGCAVGAPLRSATGYCVLCVCVRVLVYSQNKIYMRHPPPTPLPPAKPTSNLPVNLPVVGVMVSKPRV